MARMLFTTAFIIAMAFSVFSLVTFVARDNLAFAQSKNAQSASVWDAIASFFGFSKQNDSEAQDSETSDEGFLKEDALFNEQREEGGYTENALQDEHLDLQSAASNIMCLPSYKRSEEPALVYYKCPGMSVLSDSSFGAVGDSGVAVLSSASGKQFIECGTIGTDSAQRFECSFENINPAIEEFAMYPANPTKGEKANLVLKTADMQDCAIYSRENRLYKRLKNADFNFLVLSDSGKVKLSCTDLSGLRVEREITY